MRITSEMLREIAAMPEAARVAALLFVANQVDAAESRRGKDRERKRKSRGSHAEVTGNSTDTARNSADTVSPKEKSPLHPPKEITPSLSSEANASSDSKRTPADELATVLDRDRAEAVVAHRKALRKPLTQRAAQLMAGSLAACPDPAAAADMMLEKGWLTAKPEWMANATGPPGRRSQNGAAAAAITLIGEYLNGQPYDPFAAPGPGDAGGTDAGPAPDAGSPHERGDDHGWPDGSAPRQGDQYRRAPGHGGPVIDLEAIPRRA